MRDILLALALTWCLWITYDLHFNYKQDRIANLLDKMTLQILKIHTQRLDELERQVKELKGETEHDRCNNIYSEYSDYSDTD